MNINVLILGALAIAAIAISSLSISTAPPATTINNKFSLTNYYSVSIFGTTPECNAKEAEIQMRNLFPNGSSKTDFIKFSEEISEIDKITAENHGGYYRHICATLDNGKAIACHHNIRMDGSVIHKGEQTSIWIIRADYDNENKITTISIDCSFR